MTFDDEREGDIGVVDAGHVGVGATDTECVRHLTANPYFQGVLA